MKKMTKAEKKREALRRYYRENFDPQKKVLR